MLNINTSSTLIHDYLLITRDNIIIEILKSTHMLCVLFILSFNQFIKLYKL